jgi:hypothetical protein
VIGSRRDNAANLRIWGFRPLFFKTLFVDRTGTKIRLITVILPGIANTIQVLHGTACRDPAAAFCWDDPDRMLTSQARRACFALLLCLAPRSRLPAMCINWPSFRLVNVSAQRLREAMLFELGRRSFGLSHRAWRVVSCRSDGDHARRP